jgi:rod shape-determining protein MreC
MRDLVRFIYKYRITFLFIVLQAFSFYLLFSSNNYHKAQWFGASNAVVGSFYKIRNDITSYADLKEQNRILSEENQRYRDLHKSSYATTENKFVRIQDTIFQQHYRSLTAQVINSTTAKQNNYFTLDKGTKDGVTVDMGVIGPQGIVGKVVGVSESYSTAMSVLHQKFIATVQSARSGHKGFLEWNTRNKRTASIEDVAVHAPVFVGDTFFTRGSGGTFPKGAMVGVVSNVGTEEGSSYHDIEITLSTDHEALGYVYIIVDLTREERLELEEHTKEENASDSN